MTAKTRLRKIEQERAKRAGKVLGRIIPLLSDEELDRIAGNALAGMSDEQLKAIAAGLDRPAIVDEPIDPAMMARLSQLCSDDSERRLIGVPTFDGFKHPDYRFRGVKNSAKYRSVEQ